MCVTVNGRFMSQRITGVQRYAREIMARDARFARLLTPRRPICGMRGHVWEQSILPARVGRNLLWSPCNTGPLAVAKQVVTIHDCAFYDQPEGFSRKFAAWYHWLVPRLARRIRRIITVSKFSRDRLLEYCGVAPEKVVVIPHGVNGRFRPSRPDEIASVRAQLGLPERYVLHVGCLAPRKNLRRLLDAWNTISRTHSDTSLVLVGASHRVVRDVGLADLPPSVVLTGYVADEHLPALYGGADVFAFPSLYEGFGLPVLEAMACGTAVLTSNVTSLPEVAGDAALLVDPYSVESIAAGLHELLANTALRYSLAKQGQIRAGAFTWERAAEATWQVLHEADDA